MVGTPPGVRMPVALPIPFTVSISTVRLIWWRVVCFLERKWDLELVQGTDDLIDEPCRVLSERVYKQGLTQID